MNTQHSFLVFWLSLSLTLCLVFHHLQRPRLHNYGFNEGNVFKKKNLQDSSEYLSLLDVRYGSTQPARVTGVVPPIFPLNLPADLADLSGSARTQAFIELLVPDVIRVNNAVLKDRKKLLALIAKTNKPSSTLTLPEQYWFNALSREYAYSGNNLHELLEQVDIIPASLVLAQAITESAWGTSRFARFGSALYGQHVPASSDAAHMLSLSGDVRVATFNSLYEATASYIHNLNTNKAYIEMRKLRAEHRRNNKYPHGAAMAGGLRAYSEIGTRYIMDLRYLIHKYNLEVFDQAVLDRNKRGTLVTFNRPN